MGGLLHKLDVGADKVTKGLEAATFDDLSGAVFAEFHRNHDLVERDLAPEDEEGSRVDFHALRTTTGTMLALLDVPRAVTQRIMGHSDYTTTDKYYTRVSKDERRSVIDRLPDLSPQQGVMAATGTDSADRLAGRNTDRNACGPVTTHDVQRRFIEETSKTAKRVSSKGKRTERAERHDLKSMPPAGLEPATRGLRIRCSAD